MSVARDAGTIPMTVAMRRSVLAPIARPQPADPVLHVVMVVPRVVMVVPRVAMVVLHVVMATAALTLAAPRVGADSRSAVAQAVSVRTGSLMTAPATTTRRFLMTSPGATSPALLATNSRP